MNELWSRFRHWRRRRPFWGGLFLLLSAVELVISANMSLGDLEVHLGPQGFLSYVIPSVLLTCGLLVWYSPAQRLFYAVVGLITALYSFLGLNLGGFGIGMLLGIVGGGLVIAWGPPQSPVSPQPQASPPPVDAPEDADDYPVAGRRPADVEIGEHDDRPAIVPGFPGGEQGGPGRGAKAMALVFVPLVVAATALVAGSPSPARAQECPEGLPSRSVSPSTAPASKKASAKPSATKTPVPAEKPAEAATADPSPSAKPGEADEKSPIVEGIEDFFDGLGDLLGINGAATPSPSTSSSPPESPSTSTSPTTTPKPTTEPTPKPTTEPTRSATAEPTRTAKPTPTDTEIPCLGARQYGLAAGNDDIPVVAKKPGVMKVDSLTMYNSTYDGVVDMPTAGGGSFKALKFSMEKAVNKPFNLTIAEAHDATTVITSDELTTTGNVRFYTSEFKGNLFGLIPVTFTPESPPPLTLPVLWFTDAQIQLAYVRSDVLTGDPLKVTEKP